MVTNLHMSHNIIFIVSYIDTQHVVYTRVFKEYDAACIFIRPLMQDDEVYDIIFQKHVAVDNSEEFAIVESYDVVDVFSDILSNVHDDVSCNVSCTMDVESDTVSIIDDDQ